MSGNKTNSEWLVSILEHLQVPKIGQDQVSGEVSVLCWHAAPVSNVLWKPFAVRYNSNSIIRSVKRSKIDAMPDQWRVSLWSSSRISFNIRERGTSYCLIRSRTDHRTSLETISNVPLHTPAREAYAKVASRKYRFRNVSEGITQTPYSMVI